MNRPSGAPRYSGEWAGSSGFFSLSWGWASRRCLSASHPSRVRLYYLIL